MSFSLFYFVEHEKTSLMDLVELSVSELAELQVLYKVKWPIHIITYNPIRNFINRFENHPEWKRKVNFLGVKGNWIKHGTFYMSNGDQILFDTLEPSPHDEIKRVLFHVNYHESMTFINTRNIFRPLIGEVFDKMKFKVLLEVICDCYFFPKELFQDIVIVNIVSLHQKSRILFYIFIPV